MGNITHLAVGKPYFSRMKRGATDALTMTEMAEQVTSVSVSGWRMRRRES
jgi:hypothetical protein